MDDSFSDMGEVKWSASRECFLGPLLFLVYDNNLPGRFLSKCMLFARDVQIYCSLEDPAYDFHVWKADLDGLGRWSSNWQLGLSPDKCHVFHLSFFHECFLKVGSHV